MQHQHSKRAIIAECAQYSPVGDRMACDIICPHIHPVDAPWDRGERHRRDRDQDDEHYEKGHISSLLGAGAEGGICMAAGQVQSEERMSTLRGKGAQAARSESVCGPLTTARERAKADVVGGWGEWQAGSDETVEAQGERGKGLTTGPEPGSSNSIQTRHRHRSAVES